MPTPVGHSLWSLSMYIILRKKFSSIKQLKEDFFTIVLCLIIGTLPDADFILLLFVPNRYLHRSFTHSFVFVLAATIIGGWILKERKTITRPFILSFLLAGGHLFWDFATRCNRVPYGTMILWPFDTKYYTTPLSWQIFPGFDWTSWEGILSINILKQIGVEFLLFMPLLLIAFFVKKTYYHEDHPHKA